MATPYVRHQLDLHRPQVTPAAPRGATRHAGFLFALLLGLLAAAPAARAQHKPGGDLKRDRKGRITGVTVKNKSDYDLAFFHPGLYVGLNYSRFFVEQSNAYVAALQAGRGFSANSIISPGLGGGLIGDIRLGPPETHFHLRFAPGIFLLSRRVEFRPYGYPAPDSVKTQEVGTTQVDLPLLLKYQSNRRRNLRFYMLGGLKSSIKVQTRSNTPETNLLGVNNNDLLLEYGVGLDLFYPLFKFAPELRFSHGLRNILAPRNDPFSRSLQSLRTNTVTLYLNIE